MPDEYADHITAVFDGHTLKDVYVADADDNRIIGLPVLSVGLDVRSHESGTATVKLAGYRLWTKDS